MSEPVYLDRHSYVAIARAAIGAETYDALPVWRQSDAVHEAQRAHLELHVGFLKDIDLNPRQLAFREAYRAFVAPPKPVIADDIPYLTSNESPAIISPSPVVEAEPPAPIAPTPTPILPLSGKRKKS